MITCAISVFSTPLRLGGGKNRSTESDSEVDGRGGGGASHGTAAELEAAQGGVERSRFSPGRIAEFKQLAADPDVYDKVRHTKETASTCGIFIRP